jgi:methylenetetrahydrofolate reductase (NADPH)
MATTRIHISVEVVPPDGNDIQPLLRSLGALNGLPVDGFSVATNPVAKARMSALAAGALIQQHTGRPATLHCTTRDHNRLSLQSLLWGAKALGIDSVLAASGDRVALADHTAVSAVNDLDVYELIGLARNSGLQTGVVFDPHPERDGWAAATDHLKHKAEAGAQFVVTQPVYDKAGMDMIYEATAKAALPVLLGILPLRSARHAEFLHRRVAGIVIPDYIRRRISASTDAVSEGAAIAREILMLARQNFSGVCLMPPFNHYEILTDILL